MRTALEKQFTYGLNVFFNPKSIVLPFDRDVSADLPAASLKVPPGVFAAPLADARKIERYRTLLEELSVSEDGRTPDVAAWHRRHAGNGLFIRVPAGLACATPLRIDLALAAGTRAENLVVLADEDCEITIVERLYAGEIGSAGHPEGTPFRSAVTDIIARPGAKVTHVAVQHIGPDATEFSAKRAVVERGASVTWIDCLFGGSYVQQRSATRLVGEGADVKHRTLFFGADLQRFDLHQSVRHEASRTASDIKSQGALAGSAKAIYRGLVRIDPGTKACAGYQKEDTLLLGERAEIDAVPNLEIGTDDVRCGHSASIGRIDNDKLFYLMSRGLDDVQAKKMLVEGFFAPVLEEMRDSGLEDMVQCLIAERVDPAVGAC